MPAACMPASINLIRRQHLRSAPLRQSIGKLFLTTELNPPRISITTVSSHNLRYLRSLQHMSLQLLPVHTHLFTMNTRARRQFPLVSMLVNHSLNMSMPTRSLKLPSKALPTSRRLSALLTHSESMTRLQLLNTTGAQWRTLAA